MSFRLRSLALPIASIWLMTVATQDLPAAEDARVLFPGATVEPDGQIDSNWFGSLETFSFPWIRQESLGWLYAGAASAENLWFFDHEFGWVWTSPEYYPYLYLDRLKESVYLDVRPHPTGQPFAWFYSTRQWLSLRDYEPLWFEARQGLQTAAIKLGKPSRSRIVTGFRALVPTKVR